MSKKNAHTNFVPVLGKGYANEYLCGVISEVSPLLTALSTGKEYYRFGVLVTMITDHAKATELGITIGATIYRQATPERKANGQWNVMRNANQK